MKELDDFTIGRLKAIIDRCGNGEAMRGLFDKDEVERLARIALAAKTAEPVTWWTGPEPTWTGELESFHDHETGGHQIPLVPALYSYPLPNSPELPDGWKLVPIEPTESMVIDGFESAPDQFFSEENEWNAYQEMSGCQQAAHRAKLCWAAMLAAAPKPEK